MLVRLLASAVLAFGLVVCVIALGMRTLQSGPMPDVTLGPPEPVGHPLRQSDVALPRFSERDVEALRAFLAVSPVDRLDASLANGDARFLGVNGFTIQVPSVADAPRALREGRVRTIPGTTEATISEEHADLVQRASRYAGAYNALLLRRGTH